MALQRPLHTVRDKCKLILLNTLVTPSTQSATLYITQDFMVDTELIFTEKSR